MIITTITAHASTGFNHPYEMYANFKPGITLAATLTEADDPITAAGRLQELAETLCGKRKEEILRRLEEQKRAEEEAWRAKQQAKEEAWRAKQQSAFAMDDDAKAADNAEEPDGPEENDSEEDSPF